ncbi:MAG TPA: porin [Gallionellaceae bacterium]
MQKKIIALAVAAAFSAPAFADTTVYGIADAAIANISASGTQSDTLAFSGGLAGSRLGVNNSEDLGDGLKAIVNLEYSLDIETATGNTAKIGAPINAKVSNGSGIGAARQQMLALAGSFGTVATGYLQTTGFDFSKSFDPTAGSLVSPMDNIAGAGKFMIGTNGALNRAPRALAYISPDMSGFKVALNYSGDAAGGTGNLGNVDGDTTKQTAWLASANYAQGPLAAGVVVARFMDAVYAAPVAGVNETAIGVSYDLQMAKLFATFQTQKVDGANDSNKAFSISATVPVTAAGTAVVTYAKSTMDANNAAGADTNASGFTVAWLQGLSKTTTAYAAYSHMGQGGDTNAYSVAKNAIGGSANLANGTGSGMLAVGLNKKF